MSELSSYQASGGGAFLVVPLSHTGKLPDLYPLCRAHTAPVLDTAFSPFSDTLIASSGEDGKVVLTQVDEDKLTAALRSEKPEVSDLEPTASLGGHVRKVGHLKWHPLAQNVLASASMEVKVWDVEKASCVVELPQQPDIVGSMSFNWTGTLLATRVFNGFPWNLSQDSQRGFCAGRAKTRNYGCTTCDPASKKPWSIPTPVSRGLE